MTARICRHGHASLAYVLIPEVLVLVHYVRSEKVQDEKSTNFLFSSSQILLRIFLEFLRILRELFPGKRRLLNLKKIYAVFTSKSPGKSAAKFTSFLASSLSSISSLLEQLFTGVEALVNPAGVQCEPDWHHRHRPTGNGLNPTQAWAPQPSFLNDLVSPSSLK